MPGFTGLGQQTIKIVVPGVNMWWRRRLLPQSAGLHSSIALLLPYFCCSMMHSTNQGLLVQWLHFTL